MHDMARNAVRARKALHSSDFCFAVKIDFGHFGAELVRDYEDAVEVIVRLENPGVDRSTLEIIREAKEAIRRAMRHAGYN